MRDFKKEFYTYLEHTKNVSPNTLESYLRDVNYYISFLDKENFGDPVDISKEVVENYILFLEEQHKSNATITRSVASIRCFYEFMIYKNYMRHNPAKDIRIKKEQKKLPQILTGNEIEALLQSPNTTSLRGGRDKAILELLYATGARASEIIELNVEDINLRKKTLICGRGKKSERMIPVYNGAVDAITDYICYTRPLMVSSKGGKALFVNINGCRLTRQGFWKIVKNYTKQAGITKEITPYTLRHSFAIHLLKNGADLRDIQSMLGHADISSTQVYLHLLNDHCREVYDNCHPKARLG